VTPTNHLSSSSTPDHSEKHTEPPPKFSRLRRSVTMSSMETYQGHVRTPQDAIILFEACRIGLLPRVQRRLSEKERQLIKSGSVFVWDEREAGMRRWTDGKSWSASRVSGSFLTYREMEGKRGAAGFQPPPPSRKANGAKSSSSSRNGDSDGEDGPEGYRYKQDGLMKQSFSITTQDNRHLHLISYYARNQHEHLKQPSTDPALRNIVPAKGMYPEAAVNEASTIPAVTRGPMSTSPYPSAPPPQVVVAYPYPPPPHGYGPPIHHPYPPGSWPGSPAATPPGNHYAAYYPPPPQGTAFYHAPPPQYHSPHFHPYPYPPSGPPHPSERPPPHSHSTLPPLAISSGSVAPGSIPSPRPFPGASYPSKERAAPHQPSHYGSAPEPRVEASSKPTPAGTQLAPVINGHHKPPTPPPSSNGVTPPTKSYPVEPAPLRDVPANGSTTPTKIIPSINSLINGDSHDGTGEKNGSRAGSKSPANPRTLRDIPNAMAAGGLQHDKNDLKRLDSQLLKS
jgi:hypothetical protein